MKKSKGTNIRFVSFRIEGVAGQFLNVHAKTLHLAEITLQCLQIYFQTE